MKINFIVDLRVSFGYLLLAAFPYDGDIDNEYFHLLDSIFTTSKSLSWNKEKDYLREFFQENNNGWDFEGDFYRWIYLGETNDKLSFLNKYIDLLLDSNEENVQQIKKTINKLNKLPYEKYYLLLERHEAYLKRLETLSFVDYQKTEINCFVVPNLRKSFMMAGANDYGMYLELRGEESEARLLEDLQVVFHEYLHIFLNFQKYLRKKSCDTEFFVQFFEGINNHGSLLDEILVYSICNILFDDSDNIETQIEFYKNHENKRKRIELSLIWNGVKDCKSKIFSFLNSDIDESSLIEYLITYYKNNFSKYN